MREIITGETYSQKMTSEQFFYLDVLRRKSKDLLESLENAGLRECFVYGSVARGDVSQSSDIDIFVNVHQSYLLEHTLEQIGEYIESRKLTQATPNHTPKGVINLRDSIKVSITFPLLPLRTREEDFYDFGGRISFTGLKNNKFVPGINKRLEFVEKDNNTLHYAYIENQESFFAKRLGISIDTVQERIRVLQRRQKIGRSGMFIIEPISPEGQFEATLAQLAKRNPALRRYLRKYG